ncbi:leucine-rich repeat-containing protein 43 [Boleophthalmus pectinirostris]|uniref:leucine-rich repeat-containing protein 43 n=1 Tax=Boleophthalmus pectinirostris TaxID=150288 RepID=UPI00242FC054|nr:leucine-rich repeat-containing protein 43 [Boleophthalmus pectinirostris]
MACVSVLLEELIRSLGLWDFPCGPGPWKLSAGEDPQSLLDLLDCPSSPWYQEPTWSPQALTLRRKAVLSPKALSRNSVYKHLTALRLMDQGVCVLDSGLLKLSNLEELVLSANQLQEVPAPLLPASLTVLELRNNLLSSLSSLTAQPPPRLVYLGLSSNPLGSALDVCSLTGAHWPALLCLDLSFCDFENQRVLLRALSSLPCLRSLLLEGNPCSLGSSYPGLTLDVLPQLSHLDSEWVRAEEKEAFGGMALLTGAEQEKACVTVHIGRLRGLPDPPQSSDYPLLSFSYHVSYLFLPDSAPDGQKMKSESECEGDVTEENPEKNSEKNPEEAESHRQAPGVCEVCSPAHGSIHSSCSLPWSECMDFNETHHHSVCDLRALKSFLRRGICVRVEEDKTLSWPAASEDTAPKAASKEPKGAKGKDTPNKGASTKDKGKDKKKRAPPELVQDPPIRAVLGSVHVPLHSLLHTGHKVALCCDFGLQGPETPETAKEVGQMVKEKKDEDSKRGASGKKAATAKGKAKSVKEADGVSVWGPPEPLTVELCVQLARWQSAAEASQELGLSL